MDQEKSKKVIAAAIGILLAVLLSWLFLSEKGEGPVTSQPPAQNSNSVATNTNTPPPPPGGLVGTFVNASASMIQPDSITLSAPTTVTIVGQAVGNWYFEASFPIEIRDVSNNVIGVGYGQAQSDWMTTSLVPFVANVTLNAPYSGPATVILMKDNPSGEPANDASVSYNVTL